MVLIMIIMSTAMTGDRVVDAALGSLGKVSPVRGGPAGVVRARGGVVVAGFVANVGKLLVGALARGSDALTASRWVGFNIGAGVDLTETLLGSLTSVNLAEALLLGNGWDGLGKGVFVLVSKGGLSVGVLQGDGGPWEFGDTRVVGVEHGRIVAVVVEATADGFA